jgi:hypothetical protein
MHENLLVSHVNHIFLKYDTIFNRGEVFRKNVNTWLKLNKGSKKTESCSSYINTFYNLQPKVNAHRYSRQIILLLLVK